MDRRLNAKHSRVLISKSVSSVPAVRRLAFRQLRTARASALAVSLHSAKKHNLQYTGNSFRVNSTGAKPSGLRVANAPWTLRLNGTYFAFAGDHKRGPEISRLCFAKHSIKDLLDSELSTCPARRSSSVMY